MVNIFLMLLPNVYFQHSIPRLKLICLSVFCVFCVLSALFLIPLLSHRQLCYHLSPAVLLQKEAGARPTGSCVFSFFNSTASRCNGQPVCGGVSKRGATVLPPNQGGVPLQRDSGAPVEQQWLDRDFSGRSVRVMSEWGVEGARLVD